MATDGEVDLVAQPSEFSLDDLPSAEGTLPGDSVLEPLEGLEVLDDLSADQPLTESDEGTATENPDSPITEEDTELSADEDDDAALIARVQAHRLVKGDLERLSRLLQKTPNLERTEPETGRQLEQRVAELETRQTPAPQEPQTRADKIAAIQERYMRDHGREATGEEIVTALAEEAGRIAAERRFGELQAMTALEQQYNTLVVEYPWAADRMDLVQRAARTAGAMAMDGQAQPDDLLVAFRAVAAGEINTRAKKRSEASRAQQAARAAATPAVEPAAEPGEPALAEPRTWDEIRAYNLRHFGSQK